MNNGATRRKWRLTAAGWALLVILVFAAFLRFWELRDNPAWYLDEGAYLDVSANLAELELRNEALQCLFIHPSLPHPPFFFVLSAMVVKVVGADIIAVRMVAAFSSLLTVLFLFLTGKECGSRTAGLIAAAAAASFPPAMAFYRWGFTYNLAGLLAIIVLYASMIHLRKREGRAIWIAAGASGLALVTTYYAGGLVFFIAVISIATCRRRAAGVILVSLAPVILYILFMATVGWEAWASDFRMTFNLNTGAGAGPTWTGIREGLVRLLGVHAFVPLGLLGLALFGSGRRRWSLLALAVTSLEILRQEPDTHIYLYRALFFIPFIMLGVGFFCTGLARKAGNLAAAGILRLGWRESEEKTADFCKRAMLVLLLSALLIPAAWTSAKGALAGYSSPMTKWGARSHEDAIKAIKFVNEHVKKDDYVIAPRYMYWLLDCRYTGYLQAIACEGLTTTYYPEPVDPERFAFPCGLNNARYFILSNYFNRWEEGVEREGDETGLYIDILERTGWAGSQPNLEHFVRRMVGRGWVPRHRVGEYVIFENPYIHGSESVRE